MTGLSTAVEVAETEAIRRSASLLWMHLVDLSERELREDRLASCVDLCVWNLALECSNSKLYADLTLPVWLDSPSAIHVVPRLCMSGRKTRVLEVVPFGQASDG